MVVIKEGRLSTPIYGIFTGNGSNLTSLNRNNIAADIGNANKVWYNNDSGVLGYTSTLPVTLGGTGTNALTLDAILIGGASGIVSSSHVLPVSAILGVSDEQTVTNKTATSATNNISAKSLTCSGNIIDVSAASVPIIGQMLSANSAALASWNYVPSPKVWVVADVKSTGTNAGASTTTWITRTLNTITSSSELTGCTLAANVITLSDAGMYRISAIVPATGNVGNIRARIQNVTTSAILAVSNNCGCATNGTTVFATVMYTGWLDAGTQLIIAMTATRAVATSGLGASSGFAGIVEQYTTAEIVYLRDYQ